MPARKGKKDAKAETEVEQIDESEPPAKKGKASPAKKTEKKAPAKKAEKKPKAKKDEEVNFFIISLQTNM